MAVLQRNCCLWPRACVITTVIVIVFTDEMLLIIIYVRTLLEGSFLEEAPVSRT